jgi:hypothetical protein
MKNKKQIKIGSLVRCSRRGLIWSKLDASSALPKLVPAMGIYGIVCDIKDSERHSQSHKAYCVHLQNGEKFWGWECELEVIA